MSLRVSVQSALPLTNNIFRAKNICFGKINTELVKTFQFLTLSTVVLLKEQITLKKKKKKNLLSSFTHPHVALNTYDFISSVEHKGH